MSDNLDTSGSEGSSPAPPPGAGCGTHKATLSADLFSAALQQFASPRGESREAGARRHVECDSDGFDDSDDEAEAAAAEAARVATRSTASSSTSSSDSAWGTFRGGEPQLEMCNLASGGDGEDDDDDEDGVLFVPDPIFDLTSLQHKAVMPCLAQSQLPIGATVWVVDEDDVATQLNCYFSAAYPPVCNGRLSGTVVRHTGLMTLVHFDNQAADLHFALCVPTSCLSLEPVEPYESSPRHGESYGLGSGAYGMLGPRAVGRGQVLPAGQAVVVTRYLYEAVPAYDFEKLRGSALESAQDLFFQGSYDKALAAVSTFIAESGLSSSGAAAAAADDSTTSRESCTSLVDALVLRSRIFVFLERYTEALEDARTTVHLEPQWVRSHLSVARAHCGLGQFTEAAAAIAHAYIMLPYSSELERIKELNSYMHTLQSRLKAEHAGCYLILDSFYRKRLRVSTATAAGVTMCKETTPIVATHSVFAPREPVHRCIVCFRALTTAADPATSPCCGDAAHVSPTSVVSPGPSSPVCAEPDEGALYCSTECGQRASLYRHLEQKHRTALDHVRSLILSKGAVTLNILPLEMAAMAVRLFLMVVTTHRRLCAKRRLGESNRRGVGSTGSRGSAEKEFAAKEREGHNATAPLHSSRNPSPSPPVYVETALQRLGVYPLCTEALKSNRLDDLKVVYDVLTADFKTEDRSTFSCELLSQLYSYVSAYFTPVDLNALVPPDAAGHPPPHHTVYYLPNYVGCIEVAKTISYTATSRRQECACNAADGEAQLMSRVMGRPELDEPVAARSGANASGKDVPALAASTHEANCTVLPAARPALLDLVSVAPINPERKLRCVPVSMTLSSDVA